MGEAKKRAATRMRTQATERYCRGRAVMAFRSGAHPGMDADAFLTLVEAELRAPAFLRPDGAGMSASTLDSLMISGDLDDGRWHLFTHEAGYSAVRESLPDRLVPDGSEPHRFYDFLGPAITVSGTRGGGLARSGGERMAGRSWRGLLRLGADGRPVCEADAPLALQRDAAARAGADGHLIHVDVLAAEAASMARTDAIAAADLAHAGDVAGGGEAWRARHALRSAACDSWNLAYGHSAVSRMLAAAGMGEADLQPLDADAPCALALVAQGFAVPSHARAVVPRDGRTATALREWIAAARMVSREGGLQVSTAGGATLAVFTGPAGVSALAWEVVPPRRRPLDDAAMPRLAPARLGSADGLPVGAAIAGRLDGIPGYRDFVPAVLAHAHDRGLGLGDLSEAMGARARATRSTAGAMRRLVSATSTRPGDADAWLERLLGLDGLDPWSPEAPGALMSDLAALRMAETRGATLIDLARAVLSNP